MRGLAASTHTGHRQLVLGLLDFLGFDQNPIALTALGERQFAAFMMCLATGRGLSEFQNRCWAEHRQIGNPVGAAELRQLLPVDRDSSVHGRASILLWPCRFQR